MDWNGELAETFLRSLESLTVSDEVWYCYDICLLSLKWPAASHRRSLEHLSVGTGVKTTNSFQYAVFPEGVTSNRDVTHHLNMKTIDIFTFCVAYRSIPDLRDTLHCFPHDNLIHWFGDVFVNHQNSFATPSHESARLHIDRTIKPAPKANTTTQRSFTLRSVMNNSSNASLVASPLTTAEQDQQPTSHERKLNILPNSIATTTFFNKAYPSSAWRNSDHLSSHPPIHVTWDEMNAGMHQEPSCTEPNSWNPTSQLGASENTERINTFLTNYRLEISFDLIWLAFSLEILIVWWYIHADIDRCAGRQSRPKPWSWQRSR